MQPTPRSLVVDLLSTLAGHAMPVRALVAAAAVFGISPESVRVALVRLMDEGTIERNERGQYRMAPGAHAVQRHVSAWSRVEERLAPWRGDWAGVHAAGVPRRDRARLRRRDRALLFLGMRELEAGLWLRPNNLRGGVTAVRDELIALGLEETTPVFAMAQLDPATESRARALWDTEALRRGYREMCAALDESAARLADLEPSRAMVESFVLGGEGIRRIVFDPLLPEPIVPARERGVLVETMRRYDRLGRACWRAFMREHGAPHMRAPLNPQSLTPPLEALDGGH